MSSGSNSPFSIICSWHLRHVGPQWHVRRTRWHDSASVCPTLDQPDLWLSRETGENLVDGISTLLYFLQAVPRPDQLLWGMALFGSNRRLESQNYHFPDTNVPNDSSCLFHAVLQTVIYFDNMRFQLITTNEVAIHWPSNASSTFPPRATPPCFLPSGERCSNDKGMANMNKYTIYVYVLYA